MSVILRAAAAHGIFLGGAESGDGLARIQDSCAGACHGVHVTTGGSCRGRQGLEEVQRGSLAGQQSPGRTLQATNVGSRCYVLTIGAVPVHRHVRVEVTENLGKPGGTAEYAALPRAHACLGGNILRDQFGGQIARTDILLERLRYGL